MSATGAGTNPDPGEPTTRMRVRKRRTLRQRVRRWRRRPVGRAAVALAWATLAVVVLGGCLFAYELRQNLRTVSGLQEAVPSILDSVVRGDTDGARQWARQVERATGDAAARSRRPHWWVAGRLPVVGADVRALQGVFAASDELSSGVLADLVELSAAFGPEDLQPQRGRIALEPIREAASMLRPPARRAVAVAETAAAAEQGAFLRERVGRFGDRLDRTADALTRAADALQALPAALGAEGRRTYVAIFQNNAEFRATGGIPGALAIITADRGRVEMVEQGSSSTFGDHRADPVPTTAQERALFGENMGMFAQNATFTPHFPRTGELVAEMWRRTRGVRVDGVVSVDPRAMAGMLDATGPVEVRDGVELTAGRAVDLLLNTLYLTVEDPEEQNDYFADSAKAVFDALASGRGDAGRLVDRILDGVDERRIFTWFRRPAEQAHVADLALGGVVHDDDGAVPRLGVFLNDGTATKLDYYVDHRVDVRRLDCMGGRQRLEVRLRIRSSVPPDAATSLPRAVRGASPDGTTRTTVLFYAPTGAAVEESLLDGEVGAPVDYAHRRHAVVARTVHLAPGQQREVTWTVRSAPGQVAAPELRVTPGARVDGRGDVPAVGCG